MSRKKTAVILIHGIGEQVPMETLRGFVDTVWTSDPSLVDQGKPHPDTGKPREEPDTGKPREQPDPKKLRTKNASWSKPDERNRSFEMQVITTETGKNGKRIEFFEYYWAHRIVDTSWEQVRSWFGELLWRNPFRRVPKDLLPAWVFLWFIVVVLTAAWLYSLISGLQGEEVWWRVAGSAALTLFGSFIVKKLISHAGDVARYVRAKPKNIAVRQSIRENGVRLLETLMGIDGEGHQHSSDYDRIIVVGHSLGSIVGYDILTHCFGRMNDRISETLPEDLTQPARAKMERITRIAAKRNLESCDAKAKEEFEALQTALFKELSDLGNPWIVTDFITLGSPLTHAEFLLEKDNAALQEAHNSRILPTCPPTLEYDGSTGDRRFTFRHKKLRKIGESSDPEAPRTPHHAALFAFTSWTNLFSPHFWIAGGDIVSGPLADAMGMPRDKKGDEAPRPLSFIRDVQVLPSKEGTAQDKKRRIFTHLKYWDRSVAKVKNSNAEPEHIKVLRDALDLGRY